MKCWRALLFLLILAPLNVDAQGLVGPPSYLVFRAPVLEYLGKQPADGVNNRYKVVDNGAFWKVWGVRSGLKFTDNYNLRAENRTVRFFDPFWMPPGVESLAGAVYINAPYPTQTVYVESPVLTNVHHVAFQFRATGTGDPQSLLVLEFVPVGLPFGFPLLTLKSERAENGRYYYSELPETRRFNTRVFAIGYGELPAGFSFATLPTSLRGCCEGVAGPQLVVDMPDWFWGRTGAVRFRLVRNSQSPYNELFVPFIAIKP